MRYYEPEKMQLILQRAADKLKIKLDQESALEIARRSRGTPRVALKLLKRVRDFTQVKHDGLISLANVRKALDMLTVDRLGLDDTDRRFLQLIIDKHHGGPVGLTTIAATLSEDPGTVEEVLEPYLIQIGFVQRTPKGRVISEAAYKHLGLEVPKQKVE
jgi:Holliday junction DNA helicase RuvB